jgi:hypothetical protein
VQTDLPSEEPTVGGETEVAQRLCGRCRQLFDGDPTLHPVAIPEWWACPACRIVLFGTAS